MSKNKVSTNIVLKSGLWYTISNFAFRAVGFITTPVFARVLSKAEYGEYNNFTSWIAILMILAACDLHTSIIRAKLDYENDLNRYAFSILTLASIITIIIYIFVLINRDAVAGILGINKQYFHVMFIYILFAEAYNVFITVERAHYRYKIFSLITGLAIVLSSFLSVLLVFLLNNKLNARIYGQYIPYICIGIIMYMFIARRGHKINFGYYKYALVLSLPLVPHLLSLTVLSSSDRIMITKLAGAEYTAIYSVAYIVANIMAILLDSMNKAWAPWVLDSLKLNDLKSIRRTSTPYFYLFLGLTVGVLIMAPEIILVLGGEKYYEGIYVLPPLIVGCVFQFAYTMYVQIEFYEKKMKIVAIATMISAGINIILNYLFIPKFGYIAAGYTTLIGYICLFLIHYLTVCKYGYKEIFDRKKIFLGLGFSLFIIPFFVLLYNYYIIRYIILVVYIIVLTIIIFNNKEKLLNFLKKN